MEREVEILQIEKKIRNRVKSQMERSQKEYYLNEQMRAIQKELGEKDEFKNEIQELEEKIKQKKMSPEARDKAEKELKKLKMMSPMSAEATVVRNYIDWLIQSDQQYTYQFYRANSNPIAATITLTDATAVDDGDTFEVNGLTFTAPPGLQNWLPVGASVVGWTGVLLTIFGYFAMIL